MEPARQILRCAEPGCDSRVVYEPQPVALNIGWGTPEPHRPKERIRIYLDCESGHTRPYVIWPYARKV